MTDVEVFAAVHPDTGPVCKSEAGAGGRGACPRCGHLLWFASERVGGVTVIHLLDNRVAVMELLELLDNAVGDGRLDRIVLNFGTIQQVSSAALGKLIKLRASADTTPGPTPSPASRLPVGCERLIVKSLSHNGNG